MTRQEKHFRALSNAIRSVILDHAESLLNDKGTDRIVLNRVVQRIEFELNSRPFPVTIEVSGGVAEVTEPNPHVEVTIIDHDNQG